MSWPASSMGSSENRGFRQKKLWKTRVIRAQKQVFLEICCSWLCDLWSIQTKCLGVRRVSSLLLAKLRIMPRAAHLVPMSLRIPMSKDGDAGARWVVCTGRSAESWRKKHLRPHKEKGRFYWIHRDPFVTQKTDHLQNMLVHLQIWEICRPSWLLQLAASGACVEPEEPLPWLAEEKRRRAAEPEASRASRFGRSKGGLYGAGAGWDAKWLWLTW